MRRVKLFTIDALPYRQPIPVYGYRFGSRKKTLAVMGAIRGDEVQQMYTAARLVRKFSELEAAGAFAPDCGVMVVPCAGQFSMNVSKRFWPLDNTDIHRMFPGYGAGETPQRLADRIFMLEEGRIVEEGSHDSLLARGGKYAEMWKAQAGAYIEV